VPDKNGWLKLTEADPDLSQRYIDRFRALAADGVDLAGEARFVDAMLARGSCVLDAGCGTGRVGGFLAAAGHDVTGVDLDPVLVEAARRDYPGSRWLVGDLAELDLPERFDLVVSAGNVMAFLAPDSRRRVLGRLRAHLGDGGRVVVGFGAVREYGFDPGREYGFDQFFADAGAAGLAPDVVLSTWDLRPFRPDANFLVTVLSPASG
jgi:SAM-dependent methyltransferase